MADARSREAPSPAVLAVVSSDAIDPSVLDAFVTGPANGAVVTFCGVVRDHDDGKAVSALDYQAHPSAEEFLRACCARVAASTGLRVAASHRTGPLHIGDLALVASVAAPHRAEAFAACAELVELIKAQVPIWKRQHFVDGASEWVGLA
ncbi:molybdenum cofactor biosynthesis protein MoaE [Glaciibacter sp. 2TAF33]|uniref:molybdenum cofactor biosynthesis protein MoaE n=1 Tax=Glaciibacter sp. 2TAF33 TaxID=3233015 RepID=UPI003F90C754